MEQQAKKNNWLKFTAFFFGGAILAVAVYAIYEKFFKKEEPIKVDTAKPDYKLLLKVGVNAPKEVTILQNYLNSKADKVPVSKLPKLKVDGIFGDKTRERLFEFMKKNETTLLSLMAYITPNTTVAAVKERTVQ